MFSVRKEEREKGREKSLSGGNKTVVDSPFVVGVSAPEWPTIRQQICGPHQRRVTQD